MIELTIPRRGELTLEHLVCDVNGTLAVDGQLPDGWASGMVRALISLALELLDKPLRIVATLRK